MSAKNGGHIFLGTLGVPLPNVRLTLSIIMPNAYVLVSIPVVIGAFAYTVERLPY